MNAKGKERTKKHRGSAVSKVATYCAGKIMHASLNEIIEEW
jgi:hypothetical protein